MRAGRERQRVRPAGARGAPTDRPKHATGSDLECVRCGAGALRGGAADGRAGSARGPGGRDRTAGSHRARTRSGFDSAPRDTLHPAAVAPLCKLQGDVPTRLRVCDQGGVFPSVFIRCAFGSMRRVRCSSSSHCSLADRKPTGRMSGCLLRGGRKRRDQNLPRRVETHVIQVRRGACSFALDTTTRACVRVRARACAHAHKGTTT